MSSIDQVSEERVSVRSDLSAIFVSLELSLTTWLVTSLSPGSGEKMSKHQVRGGDVAGLFARFSQLQAKCQTRTGRPYRLIVIHEAGLDGFWIHLTLQNANIESHVVDPASIATSRRRRRVKTDGVDGAALVRALLAHKRGEPRVCAMAKAPTPEQEDRRQISRERRSLTAERVKNVNRIKGLLFAQGITEYEPVRRDRRQKLEALRTGDGRPLPICLKQRLSRDLDRLELLLEQVRTVETQRDALLASQAEDPRSPAAVLRTLRGIGPEFTMILWSEGLFRHFANRRQLASYAGLAPTPWQSGAVAREQGVSKAGNARLRTTMIQLSWLWLRHQPKSALTLWFHERTKAAGGRNRRVMIVALARKLLVGLWKFVTTGVVPEGAVMSAAWQFAISLILFRGA